MDDVHAFTFSIGIFILLLLNITFILAGEMLCTFVTSSKNSAPRIAWRLLSLVVTIKWVQNVVGITLSGDKLKFRCVVPVMAFVLLPVAVDNLIVVGVTSILSFSATDSWISELLAPVSTNALNFSVDGGNVMSTK